MDEQMKLEARRAMVRKRIEKAESDPDSTRPDDTLMIMHREECDIVEELLCDALEFWSDTMTPDEMRSVLRVIKQLQE